MIHTSHNGKMSAMRNQLRYLSLAFAVRPRFKHLLKIQLVSGRGRAKSRGGGHIEESRYAGLGERTGRWELGGSEAMPVNPELPDLGFKRLSGYA
jgi:hypothetical protein